MDAQDRVECPQCEKTFSSVYNMNRHVNTMHHESDDDDDVDSEEEQIEEEENEESENGEKSEEEENDEKEEEIDDDGNTIWEDYAKAAANQTDLNAKRKYVIKRYIDDIDYYKRFNRDPINERIMATKRKFLEQADEDAELSHYEALRLAIARRQEIIHEATNLLSDEEEEEEEEI